MSDKTPLQESSDLKNEVYMVDNAFQPVRLNQRGVLIREDYSVQKNGAEEEECEFEPDSRNLPGRTFHWYEFGEKQRLQLKNSWQIRQTEGSSCPSDVKIKRQLRKMKSDLKSLGLDLSDVSENKLLNSSTQFDELLGEFKIFNFQTPLLNAEMCFQKLEVCQGTRSIMNGDDYLKLNYKVSGRVQNEKCKEAMCEKGVSYNYEIESKSFVDKYQGNYESKTPYFLNSLYLLHSKEVWVGWVTVNHDWINDSHRRIDLFKLNSTFQRKSPQKQKLESENK